MIKISGNTKIETVWFICNPKIFAIGKVLAPMISETAMQKI
jgi:hypothetical protein